MDFAQRLADLRQQSPEQWIKRANIALPPIATGVLVLAIAYQSANLTWTLLSGPAAVDRPAPVIGPGTSDSTRAPEPSSYAALRGWKPFGEPPDPAAAPIIETPVDAPDTTLNLQLWGVHGASDAASGNDEPEIGAAFISSGRGEQKVYYVGDTIEGASGARLHSVYYDRVLLNRGGRLETLRLPQDLAAVAPTSAGRPDFPQPAVAVAPPAASLRDAISENVARFTEVIRIVPDMRGGQMAGFRLTPGRDREAFAALGLEPGDVLTEVNGMVLNDPQTAAQVFTALGEASMANVTVLRDGNPQVLTIDMSQIESLTENLQ